MAEALTIFAVIWVWCGLLLGLGAAVEWIGGIGRRRKSAGSMRASTRSDPGAE